MNGQFDIFQYMECAKNIHLAYDSDDNHPNITAILNTKFHSFMDENGVLRISVAGTNEAIDWLFNVKSRFVKEKFPEGELNVHSGFLAHAYIMLDSIIRQIEALDPVSVVLSGHSLGGAAAAVLQKLLEREQNRKSRCITFGSPRVFGAGADAVDLIRVCNYGDPVPHVPTAWRYRHVGSGLVVCSNGTIKKPSWVHSIRYALGTRGGYLLNHSMHEYSRRLLLAAKKI